MTDGAEIEIPGDADAFAWLAGADGALADVVARAQRDAGPLRVRFTLDANNAHRVEGVYRLGQDLRAEARFALAPGTRLEPATREFLGDFVRRALFADTDRSAALRAEDEALLLAIAPEPEPAPDPRIRLAARILYRGVRALVRETLHRPPRASDRGRDETQRVESPVLIGAYGGEHVGDAAILGGVLLGLHDRRGTRHVVLGSFRPAHTERLVRSLDVPVTVRVFHYEEGSAEAELANADGLVFAGGPLMDLPNLLVKHWNAAVEARRRGLPFIIDRIGVGPFASRPSRFVARRIARLATSLSVRTAGAAQQPEVRGLDPRIERDPAFAYLASRGRAESALSRLQPADRRDVESLFAGADGKFKVGINLRPIRHLWSPRGEAESRSAETRCLERVAEALVRVAEKLPTRFIFFPMNPIQLGGSDLLSAWRLEKLVGKRADLRVFQGDPEIDGLLLFLRRLDAAVAMRFHACIFSLSQGVPTLGIDYYAHAGGKVGELFTDCGRGDDATRIDTVETEWLAGKLEALGRAAGCVPEFPAER